MQFKLNIGETKTFEKSGKKYQISCNLFKNHDHRNKPLYDYHDGQKDNDIVATVEGSDGSPYMSPYSNTVAAHWTVLRENIIIHFTKNKDYLAVEIEEN